jgi:hypothetical protein
MWFVGVDGLEKGLVPIRKRLRSAGEELRASNQGERARDANGTKRSNGKQHKDNNGAALAVRIERDPEESRPDIDSDLPRQDRHRARAHNKRNGGKRSLEDGEGGG